MFWDIFIVHPVRLQINEDRRRGIQKYHKPTCLNVSVCCFELFANERGGVGGKIPTQNTYPLPIQKAQMDQSATEDECECSKLAVAK